MTPLQRVSHRRRAAVGHWEGEVATEPAAARDHAARAREAGERRELGIPAPAAIDAGAAIDAVKRAAVGGEDALRDAQLADLVDDRVHAVLGTCRISVIAGVGPSVGPVMDAHFRVAVVRNRAAVVVRVGAIPVHAVEGEVANRVATHVDESVIVRHRIAPRPPVALVESRPLGDGALALVELGGARGEREESRQQPIAEVLIDA
mmetsp:Transcript_2670/g.6021  ORF Transcript_2670/g.6021 Transcript_2670/m.6021 type:complete len:205 (-) Transcript_2670:19-633(-)